MAVRRSHTATSYAAIRTEGGLLPPDLLDRILNQDASLGGLRPVDYGLGESTRLMAAMSEAWQAVRTHWGSFSRTRDRLPASDSGTTDTRSWVQQVLRELGYETLRYRAAAETIGDRSFLISHRAGHGDNAPPFHITSFRQELDTQTTNTGGGEKRSPQALMQGYLNATDDLWGLLTNGLTFRLLRENRQIDRVLRVDFDLEAMLEQENFAEFQLFWLVLHQTRFVQPGEPRETAWLERWAQAATSEGARALEGLREGVEQAIGHLGQGLLEHPDNHALRHQLQSGELTIQGYYQELLRLVYRLLFLMVAEERHLLFKRKPSEEETVQERETAARVIARYQKHYSVERLRREASRVRNREGHYDDLWLGLLVTFDAMRYPKEANALGIEPLAGGLFGPGSCPHVTDDATPDAAGGTSGSAKTDGRPRLSNAALLAAVGALSDLTRDGVTRRVNYRDLDVEELGGVYEGLLDHQPALEPLANGMYRFQYGASGERKLTGSYYTPRSLVQELLNSALDPVIDQALANAKTPDAKRNALLALNVCDPACGSGHFLLGAARRIGRRLAEVKAGSGNEPDLADVRHGVREAIRRCIYGVDKNPLAIDLCKVALWIESHEPGAPISFLDNHIKRGDSLIGVFDLDVLQSGIPDAAYTAVTGDDKKVAADLKKRNRLESSKLVVQGDGRTASMHNLGLGQDDELEGLLKSLATRLDEIEAMPDGTIAQVMVKEDAYLRLQGRDDWRAMTTACTLWTWAFFAPMTSSSNRHPEPVEGSLAPQRNLNAFPSHLVPTSSTVRQMVNSGNVRGDMIGPAIGAAEEVGFFHWPLQFPEVFARGGFDTVLGNPPFVNAIEGSMSERDKLWLRSNFPLTDGTADLAFQFFSLADQVTRPSGRFSLIQPRSFLNSKAAVRLRENIVSRRQPIMIYAPDNPKLFAGASQYVAAVSLGVGHICTVSQSPNPSRIDWNSSISGENSRVSNWWELLQISEGLATEAVEDGRSTLDKFYSVAASMTTGDAYEVKPYVIDDQVGMGQKLVTTGLIDPLECKWGRQLCRYLKDDYQFPRIDIRSPLPKNIEKRVENSKRPKVIVAGLTASIEAFVDERGECIGAVSTYSIFHPDNDVVRLRQVCEALLRPAASERFRAELGGNALIGRNITMKKSWLEKFRFSPDLESKD
ncbi:MAG: Eco57I restriction-modification methylase domain-containing protein [Thermomicrobiales bacterium]